METTRAIIEEHLNAIQGALHKENEYWQEIHSAIEQYVLIFCL